MLPSSEIESLVVLCELTFGGTYRLHLQGLKPVEQETS
jgi:hypothetical protein